MMNKRKTGSETLAAFEEHLNEVTFSNLRKQVAFCNAFNSSFAKWCKPGDGISVLVPQISFHGETFGGVAKCWLFFFPDKLSMAKGLEKNLKFILSIGQTALKFSSLRAIAYFLKHFLCVFWRLSWPLAHCMDKGALDLTFSEIKFTCMKSGWKFFQAVHLFSINHPVLWIL